MAKPTEAQRANLLLAIDRAEGKGDCSYRAGCVIAQLADIEDPSGATREALTSVTDEAGEDDCIPVQHCGVHPALAGYDPKLLRCLQSEWDTDDGTEADARRRMRLKVEGAK